MRRDPTEFRKRFALWKQGGKPYLYGIPYDDDNHNLDYDQARATQLGYGADETGHYPTRDYETGRYLKSPAHPTVSKSIYADMGLGYDIMYNEKDKSLYSQPNWGSTYKERLPKYEGGKPADATWHENWLNNRLQLFEENYNGSTEEEKLRYENRNSGTIDNLLNNLRNSTEYSDKDVFLDNVAVPEGRFKGANGVVRLGKNGNNIIWSVGNDGYEFSPHDTTQHERTHALSRTPKDLSEYNGIEIPQHSKIKRINEKYKNNLYSPSDFDYTDDEGVFHPYHKPNEYDDTPDEIYAELNEFRKRAALNPNYKVTKEDLKKWRDSDGQFHLQDRLGRFNDDVLIEYFNEVASNPNPLFNPGNILNAYGPYNALIRRINVLYS